MRIDVAVPRNAPLAMRWRDVAFLSWRFDAEALARVLPPGIEVDRYDGDAWVSVVPFRITDLRLHGIALPLAFGSVAEINLRTYVRVGDVPGVWFFSLDAASPLLVRGARAATGLPYFDARISVVERDGDIAYTSERRETRDGGRFHASYAARGMPRAAAAGSLDEFLCERYRFFVPRHPGLYVGNVAHEPWSLEALDVRIFENTLGARIGASLGVPPDAATFGRDVAVRAPAVRRIGAI